MNENLLFDPFEKPDPDPLGTQLVFALEQDGFALVRTPALGPHEAVVLTRDWRTPFPSELMRHATAIYTRAEWEAFDGLSIEEARLLHAVKTKHFRGATGPVRPEPQGERGAGGTGARGQAAASGAPQEPAWVPPDRVGPAASVAPQRASW